MGSIVVLERGVGFDRTVRTIHILSILMRLSTVQCTDWDLFYIYYYYYYYCISHLLNVFIRCIVFLRCLWKISMK